MLTGEAGTYGRLGGTDSYPGGVAKAEQLPLAERLVNIAGRAVEVDQLLDGVEARLLGQPPSYGPAEIQSVPGRPAVYDSVSAIELVLATLQERARRICNTVG